MYYHPALWLCVQLTSAIAVIHCIFCPNYLTQFRCATVRHYTAYILACMQSCRGRGVYQRAVKHSIQALNTNRTCCTSKLQSLMFLHIFILNITVSCLWDHIRSTALPQLCSLNPTRNKPNILQ